MKNVQVFLKGDEQAEINGELVSYQVVEAGIWVTHREGRSVTTHFVPHINLHMMRVWKEK